MEDISVQYESGKTNLIIGRSGSGKTVLLKTLVGLHEPDTGKIFYDDKCYTELSFAQRKEVRREDLKGLVDYVLTYEETHAILGGMGIELGEAHIHPVECSSRRSAHGFAENGGVTAAVKELVDGKIDFTTLQIAGLNKKNVALLKAYGKSGKAPAQFIEVMVCDGGCISGPSVHTAYGDGKKTFDAELKKR